MILTKCDCDDSFHERLLDLFSLYSLRYNFPQSCSGRVSSPNPLPANFGTEVLFDVATKSPICCHIDFLAAGGGGLMEAGRLGASERSQGSEHRPANRASTEGS